MTSEQGRFVAVNYAGSDLNLEPVLTFFRSMSFDVTVRPEKPDDPPLTYERSIDLFRTIASLDYFPNLHSASCLVLCIFGHVGDHLENAYTGRTEIRRDSIRCADNRHLSIQQLVDCFNDPHDIGGVTLATRLPIFFFINHYRKNDDQETKQVESNSPYWQIIQKNPFFICCSTYTKSWLPRRLKALYRANGDKRHNLGDLLKTKIIKNMQTISCKRFKKSSYFSRVSFFETTEFWRLLWNCTNNSFDENVDDDEVASNEDIIYEISSNDRDSVSTSRLTKSGLCLILNYKTKQDDSIQSYAENDQLLIAHIFERFNFGVQIEEALTANTTKEALEKESQKGNLYSALALVIIARTMTKTMYDVSGDDEIECAKRETYRIADVLKHFGDDTNWAGKPKLFFIMHWDGFLEVKKSQTLFYKMHQTNYLDKSTTFDLPKDSLFFLSSRIGINKRNQNSYLINEISELLINYGKRYDVMTILQQLNFGCHFTSERFYSDNARNFFIRSSLQKLLFLSSKNDLRKYIASFSVSGLLSSPPEAYNGEIGKYVRIFSYSIQDLRLPINITDIAANRIKQKIENLENRFNMMKFSSKLFLGSPSTWIDLLESAYLVSKNFKISSNVIERSCIVCYITILNHLNLNSEEVEKENNKLFQQLYDALRFFFLDNRVQAYQRLPIFILIDYHLAKPKSSFEDLSLSSLPTSNASCNFSQYFSNLSMCGNIFFSFTQKSCIDYDINDDRCQLHSDSTESNASEIRGIELKDNENCITPSSDDMEVPYDENFAPTITSMIDDDQRDSSIYEMKNMNCGLCIVLYKFENKSEFSLCQNLIRDTAMLEFTFHLLGFRVESFGDLSAVQTKDLLQKVAEDDHWSDTCLVLCLITRYENGYFYCTDKKINLENTLKMFDSNESLSGKPKIVFIEDPYQNRRIIKPDVDVLDSLRPTRINTLPPDFLFVQTLHFEENFPNHLPTFLNNFYDKNGSWFIRSLFNSIEKLPDFAHCVDFLTILRSICSNGFASPNFVRKFWLNYKALPNIHIKSTLRRRLIFKPKMKIYANFLKINPKFGDSLDVVETRTSRDTLFYNREGKGRVLVVMPIAGGHTQPITSVDEELQKLREEFEKLEFDFEVRLIGKEEMNRKSIMNFLQDESQRNHNQYNCLILFILLDERQLLPIDFDQEIAIENFTKHKSLIGKPKLIFVLGEMSGTASLPARIRPETDSDQSKINSFQISKFSDLMLFRCDLVSDFVIKCFADLLRSYANTLHVTTILTLLLQEMAPCSVLQDIQNRIHITSTFSRLFYIGLDFQKISDENYQAQLHRQINNFFANKKKRNLFIFNHEIYDKSKKSVRKFEPREGTASDVATLQTVFKALNFNIEPTFQDLTVDQAREELKKIEETDFTESDCIALCYLSHGIENGVLYCHDGEINLDDIVQALSENQTLIDKPKMIFVQACRGNRVDPGALVTDGDGSLGVTLPSYSQPELFIFSSSYPGFLSFRHTKTGSWFINALGETLSEHYVRHDLLTMAAIVCRKVALQSDEGNSCKQTPVVHSTLSKLFYFKNQQKNDN